MFEFCSKPNFLIYFVNLENLVELVIFLLGWVFLITSNYDIEMAYHASAWMIFWAWINLLLYMGRLNLIGKYIFMSLHVIKILCLCLFAYLPVFFAFTFGYYILLQANDNFNGYFRGFLSVLAMMVDEIGYRLFIFRLYIFITNLFATWSFRPFFKKSTKVDIYYFKFTLMPVLEGYITRKYITYTANLITILWWKREVWITQLKQWLYYLWFLFPWSLWIFW